MNVSMHTNSQCDGLPVKVGARQVKQLILGEEPKLNSWERFCNFFINMVCCGCGGTRRASERQLWEIFSVLHPQTGEGMPQGGGGDVNAVMTNLEKLVSLTDVPHQRNYHIRVGDPQNGVCQLIVFFGPHHLVELEITAAQKVFLGDHCLCEEDSVQGTYNLRLGMPPEEERRARLCDYDLVEQCLLEISCHGGTLCTKVPPELLGKPGTLPLEQQQQTLGGLTFFGLYSERRNKNEDLNPRPGENGLEQQIQQIEPLGRSYQDYRESCTQHNTQRVKTLLEGIHHARSGTGVVTTALYRSEMEDIFTHTRKHGLYDEEMTTEFVENAECFMEKMHALSQIKERYPLMDSAEACEEALSILAPEGLEKVTGKRERERLKECRQYVKKAYSKVQGSGSGASAGVVAEADDQQKVPGKKHFWDKLRVKKVNAPEVKAPEVKAPEEGGVSSLQKELLDTTKEAA